MGVPGPLPLTADPWMLRAWPGTRTERTWLAAASILAVSVAAAAAIYFLENHAGRWTATSRFVYSPAETVTRLFGIAHVLVATLFLVSSRSMRAPRAWALLGVNLALGVALCLGYAQVALVSPVIASALFFLYFAAHDFRDQVFFYFQHGDAPAGADRRRLGAILFWAPMCLLLAAATATALFFCVLGAPGTGGPGERMADVAPAWRLGLTALVASAAAGSALRLLVVLRGAGAGPLRRHLQANRPIYRVLAGTLLVAGTGAAVFGTSRLIVILHVTAWYVYSLRLLRDRAAAGTAPPRGSWRWLRETPAGFNVLHLGALGILAAALALWVYGFRTDPGVVALSAPLDVEHFSYWTLLHVTLSFRPR